MMKWFWRVLAVIIVAIVAVVIYIEVNKKDLLQLAVDEANKSLNGELTYEDADISLLASFPSLKISFEGLSLTDAVKRESTPVISAGELSMDVDLISAIRKNFIVNAVSLSNAQVYLANYKDGTNNYSLTTPSEGGEETHVDFDINTYELSDVDFVFSDQSAGQKTSLMDIDAEGKLNYKSKYIYLINEFTSRLQLDYGALLPSYSVALGGVIENTINPAMDSIGINRSELLLNDLPVRLKGDIRLGDEVIYNFDFGSPATEIKRLVSLLPNFYKNQYKDLISKGTYVLNGTINGNTSDQFPRYKLSVMTKDGQLEYPDLDASIEKLNFSLLAENASTNNAYSKLVIDDLDIKTGESMISGDFLSVPSGQDHNVNFDLMADVNLNDINKSIKADDATVLEGIVKGTLTGGAKINPQNNQSSLSEQRFETDMVINNLRYRVGSTSLSISDANLVGDKNRLRFESQDVSYNDAIDMDVTGYLEAPLSVVMDSSHVVRGLVDIVAGKINLDKLHGGSADTIAVTSFYNVPSADFKFQFAADEIVQGVYSLGDLKASGNLSDELSKLQFSISEFNGSQFEGTAQLNNLLSYALNAEVLSGDVDLKSGKLDLNQFMHTGEGSDTGNDSDQALIPDNIDLNVKYESEEIVFKNIDIAQSLGDISIADKKIVFTNKGKIFGGEVSLTGTFDTDREEGYHIGLALDLKKLGFSQTAAKIKLFNLLLPIAKFLEGEYSAALSWSSDLDNNYMPDLNSLTAKGVIQTKNGRINGLLPIDSFLNRFDIVKKSVEPIKLNDENRYFIVEDGKVMVQDVHFRKGDINVTMAGTHSFNQQMDYSLKIDVPKKIANVANVIDLVQNKIKFNEKIKSAGDNISLEVEGFMGGDVLKPKFGVRSLNLKKGDVVENIEDVFVATVVEVKDSIVSEVRDTITAVKDKAEELVDSIKTGVQDTIQAAKDQVKDAVDSTKILVQEELDKQKEGIKDTISDIFKDVLSGKSDSVDISVEDIFKQNKGALDSLKSRIPLPFFAKKKKKD